MSTTKSVLKGERLLVLAITLALTAVGLTKLLDPINNLVYDQFHPYFVAGPNDDIAIITIDNQSIDALGRWPWPRSTHAALLKKLNDAQAQTIVFNILFSEPESTTLLSELNKIRSQLYDGKIVNRVLNSDQTVDYQGGSLWLNEYDFPSDIASQYTEMQTQIINELRSIDSNIETAINGLNGDELLSKQLISKAPIVMPIFFEEKNRTHAAQTAQTAQTAPDFVTQQALGYYIQGSSTPQRNILPTTMGGIHFPIDTFGKHVRLGHTNMLFEQSDKLRSMNLLFSHNKKIYPSIALTALATSAKLDGQEISFYPGVGVYFGGETYYTDENANILPYFNTNDKNQTPFKTHSFISVLNSEEPLFHFKNKIVVIGVTADGLGTHFSTPTSPSISAPEVIAYTINALAKNEYFYSPPWSRALTWLMFFLLAIVIFLFVQKMYFKRWILIAGLCLTSIFVIQIALLQTIQIWLPLGLPTAFVLSSFIIINLWRYKSSETRSFLAERESSENNLELGLAYQTQGQFDLAFDKFRRCKQDERLAESLYSLGLDIERKRMPQKAGLVYNFIQSFQENFRDVNERVQLLPTLEDHAMISNRLKPDDDTATIDSKSTFENPTFGRYRVEEQIGRGGMGAVYLGHDPKIDRKVAIKTLDFQNNYVGEHLEEARERFFVEARAAGRLEHKNIVTLYDVGEEHDLAYIAMAYLPGADLSHYAKEGSLLPIREVVNIGLACADALDLAHKSNIVHRDIKPSNIIYDVETKTPWITDFGIALLANSELTQPNMTLGSPSYMSPEQLRGETLDGRSDIYSLGVTLFQLITGTKPYSNPDFSALAYRIAHGPIPSLLEIKPNTSKAISNVVFTAMQKDKKHRYASAAIMREALRSAIKEGAE